MLAGITILRLTNEETFGDRDLLVIKLRGSYRKARQQMSCQ